MSRLINNSFCRRWFRPQLVLIPLLLALGLLPGGIISDIPGVEQHLMDALHFPGGILVSLLLIQMQGKGQRFWLTAITGSGFFFLLEGIQPWFGRYQSLSDALVSATGVLTGCLFVHWYRSQDKGLWGTLLVLALIFQLWLLWPLWGVFQDYHVASQRFPLLGRFDQHDKLLWRPTSGATATTANGILHVEPRPESWSGVIFNNIHGSWQAWEQLCFDARASHSMRLHIRLDGPNSTDYQSRWHQQVALQKQWQHYCLQLKPMQSPEGETLNRETVRKMVIYTGKKAQGSFWLRALRLAP